jgi:predicted metal-dependent hydrolase
MDAQLREGVRYFNAGRFFDSHESLEDFYLRTEEEHKPFLEGLVQLAAACHMFTDLGEVKGPVRMIRQAIIRLENYQPNYLGIRVGGLIRSLEEWTKLLEAGSEADSAHRHRIPKIRLHWFSPR